MNYIPIGTITNTHGLKGALSIKTDSDFKESRYQAGNKLYIHYKKEYCQVTVKGYYPKGTLDIVTFDEFSHINDVEVFKTCTIYTTEDAREPLEDDSYYVSDLIGTKVKEGHQFIGIIKEVRNYPQGDIIVIQREGLKDVLIPFRNEFIVSVSQEEIVVKTIEGLL